MGSNGKSCRKNRTGRVRQRRQLTWHQPEGSAKQLGDRDTLMQHFRKPKLLEKKKIYDEQISKSSNKERICSPDLSIRLGLQEGSQGSSVSYQSGPEESPRADPGALATSARGQAAPEPGVQKQVVTKNSMALRKTANSSPNCDSFNPGGKDRLTHVSLP